MKLLIADSQRLCQDDFACIDVVVEYGQILLIKSVVITDLMVTAYKRNGEIDVTVR